MNFILPVSSAWTGLITNIQIKEQLHYRINGTMFCTKHENGTKIDPK